MGDYPGLSGEPSVITRFLIIVRGRQKNSNQTAGTDVTGFEGGGKGREPR